MGDASASMGERAAVAELGVQILPAYRSTAPPACMKIGNAYFAAAELP
jgi:hypothetical protein